VARTRDRYSHQRAQLALAYYQHTGRQVVDESDLEWINDVLHAGPPDVLTGRHFSDRLLHFLAAARSHFALFHLEIGDVPTGVGELLHGDNPMVTPSDGRPGLAPHQGVALMDASAVALPLGPFVVASLHHTPTRASVDPGTLDKLNGWQRQAAMAQVFSRR